MLLIIRYLTMFILCLLQETDKTPEDGDDHDEASASPPAKKVVTKGALKELALAYMVSFL